MAPTPKAATAPAAAAKADVESAAPSISVDAFPASVAVVPKSVPNAFALDAASLREEESILSTLFSTLLADVLTDSNSAAAASDADDTSVSPAVLASIVSSIARSSKAPICEARVSSFAEISLMSPVTVIPSCLSVMRIPP